MPTFKTTPEGRLCTQCRLIFSAQWDWNNGGQRRHYANGSSFIYAAENGCYFCAWALRRHQWYNSEPVYETYYRTEIDHVDKDDFVDAWKLDIWTLTRSSRFHAQSHIFFGVHSNLPRIWLDDSTRSERSFSLAKKWLEDCKMNHPQCNVPTGPRSLPTRLVHVQQDGVKLMARICRGDALPSETQYLSLSHCWGKVSFLTTTLDNLDSHEASLPVELLSRTFQDALLATVRLGLEYIWIDSLCIVQDDPADWKRESSLMHQVYKNARCNISAAGFANGQEGFALHKRSIDPTPILATKAKTAPQEEWDLGQGPKFHDETYVITAEYPFEEVLRAPLFRRAWVLQEQLLAPRALHFCGSQIYWECKRTVASEVWPHGWSGTGLKDHTTDGNGREYVWQLKIDNDFLSTHESPYHIWCQIASHYSKRNLTFTADRLFALAGISAQLSILLHDEFLNGIWKKDLHRGLLFFYWANASGSTPSKRIAPSWSWAAQNNEMQWDSRLWTAEVMHSWKIEGFAHQGKIRIRLVGMPIQSHSFQTWGNLELKNFEVENWPDGWFQKTEGRELGDDFVVMPIICLKSRRSMNSEPEPTVWCLILQPQPGIERGIYKRVGVTSLTLPYTKYPEADLDTVFRELRELQKSLEDCCFEKMDEEGNYSIVVV